MSLLSKVERVVCQDNPLKKCSFMKGKKPQMC